MHHHLPEIERQGDDDIFSWATDQSPFFFQEHFDVSMMHGSELIIGLSPT